MTTGYLSAEQVASFERDGYLVLPKFFSSEVVSELSAGVASLVARFEASGAGASAGVFEVAEQARAASDAYFLASADKVVPFLEPSAIAAGGGLKPGLTLFGALNKIGHALHELEPVFRAATFDARVAGVCESLGYAAPVVPQSMVIVKPAHVGAAVPPHVDGAFLHTTPHSCLGFWTPLERCTKDNGCLWAVPGSHAGGKVGRVFRRNAAGTSTAFDPPEAQPFDIAGAVALEMEPGDLVILHAALVHFSEANTSASSRCAYSWHAVENGNGVVYDSDNWLQRSDRGPFPALYTAAKRAA